MQTDIMTAKIKINANGSIRVEGNFELYDHNENKYDLSGRNVIALCRCGASENKPFCDGKHKACNFESSVTACVLPPKKA